MNEYRQELYFYSFAVKLNRCVGGCNTLNDLSNKVCTPNRSVDASVKSIKYVRQNIFGILLHEYSY